MDSGLLSLTTWTCIKNIGGIENLDHALIEYSAASMHFANAGHIRHLAGVENNLGFILLLLGKTAEALTHLDKARAIFVSLKDSRTVAQVNDTRARVFLAVKRFAEAERAIFAAVTVLEQGEDSSLLAEALTTEGSIFAASGKYDSARKAFNRASEVAAAAGDSHFAAVAQLRMIEELGGVLSRGLSSLGSKTKASGELKLLNLRHALSMSPFNHS